MSATTLGEVLNLLRERVLSDVRVALPAKIEAFDRGTQLARVQPLLWETSDAEDGSTVAERLPVVSDVPVQFPGTSAFALTFDVQPGDFCLLVFSDRALDKWIGDGGEVEPGDARRHHLSDAVALLGVRPSGGFAEVSAGCAALVHKDGVGVYVKEGTVNLGSKDPGDALALASKVKDELEALRDAYANHGHNVATAGTAASQAGTTSAPCSNPVGTPTPPLLPQVVPQVGSVASDTVKAD